MNGFFHSGGPFFGRVVVSYRTDAVYLDSPAGPFIAESLRCLEDGAFACCIGRDVVVTDERNDAGNVYDFTWSLDREELFPKFLACDVGRFQVDVYDLEGLIGLTRRWYNLSHRLNHHLISLLPCLFFVSQLS
jgi:hypothetical protein